MSTAISELRRLPENKDEVQTFAQSVIDQLMDGNVTPIEVAVRMKLIEQTIKLIQSDPRVKMLFTDEIAQGNTNILGATLSLKQRKTWHFEDDAECSTLLAQLKARQTLLKQLKGADPDTGEVVAYQTHSEFINIQI